MAPAQRVVVDHILKRDRTTTGLDKGRGSQFQPQYRLQVVDGAEPAGRGVVAMRFIHDQRQVVQSSQVVEAADILREPLDARGFAAATSELIGDAKDIDSAAQRHVKKRARRSLVVIAGDDVRRVDGELAMPLKTYLGVFGVKLAINLL